MELTKHKLGERIAHLPHGHTLKQLPQVVVGVSTLKRKNFESLGPILELAKFSLGSQKRITQLK